MSIACFRDWFRAESVRTVHFNYGFFAAGLLWLCLSLAATFTAYCLLRKGLHWIAGVVVFVLALATVLSIPNANARAALVSTATTLLAHADHSLAAWDDMHGRFPTTESEVLQALRDRPLSEPRVFSIDGHQVEYTVRFAANASGPSLSDVPTRPGVFVYAVGGDFQEYWLTITTLDNPVGGASCIS